MTRPTRFCGVLVLLVLLVPGCESAGRRSEPFGKTYYLDGAGNLGFGASEVPRGLLKAGYEGDVEVFPWTYSLNPLIDQWNLFGFANAAGERLAKRIKDYKDEYPQNQVNVIALSAGTGVAVWGCEALPGGYAIDNLFLLGSSLSNNYDMSRAMPHIRKRIYVYYSPHDSILETVEVVGTIDGKTGVKSVGQVGLRSPAGGQGKIVNTAWSEQWRRLGWDGGHTDCTRERFVRQEIAPKIITTLTRHPDGDPYASK